MTRPARVDLTISVEDPVLDVEREYEVECLVTPGSPGRGPSLDGPGEPPEDPEVEVTLVRDALGALPRYAQQAFIDEHLAEIEERAVERALEADEDREAARADYEWERAKDRRLGL